MKKWPEYNCIWMKFSAQEYNNQGSHLIDWLAKFADSQIIEPDTNWTLHSI